MPLYSQGYIPLFTDIEYIHLQRLPNQKAKTTKQSKMKREKETTQLIWCEGSTLSQCIMSIYVCMYIYRHTHTDRQTRTHVHARTHTHTHPAQT